MSLLRCCIRPSVVVFAVIGALAATDVTGDEHKASFSLSHFYYPSLSGNGIQRQDSLHASPPGAFSIEKGITGPLPAMMETPARWDAPFGGDPFLFGGRIEANEAGRVRTSVITGRESTNESPDTNEWATAWLRWQGRFTRTSSVDPTFTLNKSDLRVAAQQPGDGLLYGQRGTISRGKGNDAVLPIPPYAQMEFEVKVIGSDPADSFVTVFHHRSRVEGIGGLGTRTDCGQPITSPALTATPYRINYADFYSQLFILSQTGEMQHDVPQSCQITNNEGVCYRILGKRACFGERETTIHYEVGPYTQEIDLSAAGIQPGEQYDIVYQLRVEAGEDDMEQFAESWLGDPLENDGAALTLTTLDEPTVGPTQVCDRQHDPQRFASHGDGTVTDQRTGLMWQRCPADTVFEDGDSATSEDDLCTPGAAPASSWEEALAAAAGQDTGGYEDWRLPNVKELQSLVLARCEFAAIDRHAFPDTPWRPFWSSTPQFGQTDILSAYAVNFALGSVDIATIDTPAFRRYVRRAADPLAATPALRAGNARVVEGDPGANVQLSFPVRLSAPADAAVEVDASVSAGTAEAGVDYEPVNLRLVIPQGEVGSHVDVTVIGDFDGEASETVRLRLTNPSSNAYIDRASADGIILDSEPLVDFEAPVHEVTEGVVGGQASLALRLSKPAVAAISVDYETRVATAGAAIGSDFGARQGTVVFGPGEEFAEFVVPIVDDGVAENDETFEVVLSNPDGGSLADPQGVLTVTILDDDGPLSVSGINDSALRFCADASAALLACPQPGYPLQDAEAGPDALASDDTDGGRAFAFTKLDASGNELPVSSTTYSCLRDDVTKMVWEMKNNDSSSLHYQNSTYTWRNTSGVGDGGDPGVANGGSCAGSDCDTEAFVSAVNGAGLCGYTDWRLPTAQEAYDLASFDSGNGSTASLGQDRAISFGSRFNWTSTAFLDASEAWYVEYAADSSPEARLQLQPKSTAVPVRLVRAEPNGRP